MTLEQLRIFVAVAEREHVTRAAEALHLTQSAVSAAIAALEARFGVKLFHRVGRNIVLSEAGKVFLEEARAVLARAAAAERALADLSGLKRGRLVLAASQTIAAVWLPDRIAQFRQSWPDIHLQVMVGNTAQVSRMVAEGEVDLGFVEGEIDAPLLVARPVAEDQLLLVAPPTHPWAGRSPENEELLAANWVMREPGSGTRALLLQTLARRGVAAEKLQVVLELPSNEAVRTAIVRGVGVGALSADLLGETLSLGRLVAIPFEPMRRRFRAVWHRDRHRSRAAQALLDLVGHLRPPVPAVPAAK
jgi:DNA-binding transcriptional LysR family regulator